MRFHSSTAIAFLCTALTLGLTLQASAQAGESLNVDEHGVFLNGYDVVAYFNANEAIRGSSKYSTEFNGAKFRFSSSENLKAFQAEQAKYMPKYGGFCAFAMAHGKAGVPTNPQTFKFYNGELLMFFNDLYEGNNFNTSVPWNAEERSLHAKAEANWTKLSK